MSIRAPKYSTLKQLLEHELETEEDMDTATLLRDLSHIKHAKQVSKDEFVRMCRWKSPRPVRHYARNSEDKIKRVFVSVLSTRSERRRLELLTSLRGVSVPTASAILTMIDPKRYGVIDIRVWQLLFKLRSVRSNPSGIGFAFHHWYNYLCKLRHWAKHFNTSARLIELTLFKHHKRLQVGQLYRSQALSQDRSRKADLHAPIRLPIAPV